MIKIGDCNGNACCEKGITVTLCGSTLLRLIYNTWMLLFEIINRVGYGFFAGYFYTPIIV